MCLIMMDRSRNRKDLDRLQFAIIIITSKQILDNLLFDVI